MSLGSLRGSFALALVLLVGGCVGTGRSLPDLDAQERAYRAGGLSFSLEAVATVREDVTGVDVYLSIPRSGLVFRATGEDFEAIARWTVTLEREEVGTVTADPIDTVRVANPEAGRTAEPVRRVVRLDAAPGTYNVRAVLEDAIGDRTAEQRVEVEVVAPTGAPTLGGLRLEGRLGEGPVTPLVASSLPAGVDSLRAVAQVLAAPDSGFVVATVVRFQTDTTVAVPLSAFTPSGVSLTSRGVDLGRVDTIQVVRQPLISPAEAVRIEAPVPSLGPGVYRLHLALFSAEGDGPLTETERLVVVRRRDYPLVTRLGDLVGPLAYIADPDEMRRLERAIGTPMLQQAYDRFWGDRLDDRRVGAATIRAYYERVEEANRLFGTQKEGWKTDPGMVYILFGPPAYVESKPRSEVWSYGIRGVAPPTIAFERTAGGMGSPVPFQVLTLVRDRGYHDTWLRVRRLWRSGNPP